MISIKMIDQKVLKLISKADFVVANTPTEIFLQSSRQRLSRKINAAAMSGDWQTVDRLQLVSDRLSRIHIMAKQGMQAKKS